MIAGQNPFMTRTIELSIENALSGGGGPFAAVVVLNGKIIAEGVNQVTSSNDPTAHAEIVAIREACKKLATFELKACDVYTSCEPCPMCLGAIYWARIAKVYFANTAEDAAKVGFDDELIYSEITKPYSQRQIAMIPVMREQALRAFRVWQERAEKTSY